MSDQFLLPLFILNTLLTLIDAATGYRLAPRLIERFSQPDMPSDAVRSTRSMLSAVVALYMFFSCIGYFQGRPVWSGVVTMLLLADMSLQVWLVRRSARQTDEGEE